MATDRRKRRRTAAKKGGPTSSAARSPAPGRGEPPERSRGDGRRFPRLRARCRVLVRDRYGTWEAETEDVGPRGCRIVTPRPQTVGTVVGLTVESGLLPDKLEVTGQVVWAARERPAHAGISFAGSASVPGAPGPAAWFKALEAAERRSARPARTPVPLAPPPPDALGVRADAAGSLPAAELARRLVERARELVASGAGARAALILRRALALAPGDAAAEALLRQAEKGAEAG